MKKLLLLILMSLFCANTMAESDKPVSIKTLVDTYAKTAMQENHIPGMVVAIHYQGKDYVYPYGFADSKAKKAMTANTIMEVASISKVFTTTLLAIAVDDDKVKLSDPITQYLPTFRNTQQLPVAHIHIENLATHTASLPRDVNALTSSKNDENKLMKALSTWHPAYAVGSRYVYSNVSFGLLGRVLEYAYNEPFSALLSEKITKPLAMSNTFVTVPADKQANYAQGYRPNGNPAPHFATTYLVGGGSLVSSANDLLTFMKANLGMQVAEANAGLLYAMQFAQRPLYKVHDNFSLGLGWQVLKRHNGTVVTKNGINLGFNSFIGFSPTQKLGVVVLANKRDGKASIVGNKLLNQLLAIKEVTHE